MEVYIFLNSVRANLQAEVNIGTVLAVGNDYWDKKKRFCFTELKVGDRVIFDVGCPWLIDIKASDGLVESRSIG